MKIKNIKGETMKIELITSTPNPLRVIYESCKMCVSKDSYFDRINKIDLGILPEPDQSEMLRVVKKVINSGHLSVLEHVSFTFAISGVSRAFSHQLTRTRTAKISQKSQRYVSEVNRESYIIPPSIKNNSEALEIFTKTMEDICDGYDKLLDLGILAEDARFLLPNATETHLIWTIDLRNLLHTGNHRLCATTQWEYRNLFGEIKKELLKLPDLHDIIDIYLQPKCVSQGYCNEMKGCGKYEIKGYNNDY